MIEGLNHLGVIIDGNRRWAKDKGLMPWDGHVEGYKNVLRLADWCLDRDIPEVTVWVFSTENWKRPADEVGFLMNLIKKVISEDSHLLLEKKIQLKIVGRKEGLPADVLQMINGLPTLPEEEVKMILNVALNYGGKAEIVDAVKSIVSAGVNVEAIDSELLKNHMYVPTLRPLDFIIRTSGEKRLSGFLLWHSDYAELYFVDKKWPDFDAADLDIALDEFGNRQRRFGGQ
jgi:undecaprenyl diphosphate synthase